jgi:hypothetical protein
MESGGIARSVSIAWLALVVTACAAAGTASRPQSWDGARFESLKLPYMAALDDRPVDETAVALQIEQALGHEVDEVLRAHAAGGLRTDEARGQAGLVLIYDALLLQRNWAHAQRGKIDPAKLAGDGAARRSRAIALLELAGSLRPQDGRIASWLAATRGMAEPGPDGAPTAARKEQILAAVDVEPSFNLFTAYIAMRDEPADTPYGRALFAETRAFIAARKCRDVEPGTQEARNCESGPLAPYNLQAATVMLGDQYLRQGEDALRRGAMPEAMELLGTADGIYATLSTERRRAETARWSKAPLLEIRRERVAALKPGTVPPDPAFWSSAAYASVYDCASCHVAAPL